MNETLSTLVEITEGRAVLDQLITPLFSELRDLADRKLRRNRAATLEPTELVQEAYLRLIGQRQLDANKRTLFVVAAASAMRRVLIDRARSRGAERRGGNLNRTPLTDTIAFDGGTSVGLLDLESALCELEEIDSLRSRVAELSLFSGLEHGEIADALKREGHELSTAAVGRSWRAARAWLRKRLSETEES